MYALYRGLASLLSPLVPLLLQRRLARDKEDPARIRERLGEASIPRPAGKLLWIHAASVGEANAVLPLIEALLADIPALHILLTTVTTTSATLMHTRLPLRAVHQFAPVDTPQAVGAFLDHWQPDVALWVDSELWPTLIIETHKQGAVLGLVNARLSQRSFDRWRLAAPLVRRILACFAFCFAQSTEDAGRLEALGMMPVRRIGNLKYDAPALPCDEKVLGDLINATRGRPIWLAVSTHLGEEEIVARVHEQLAVAFPNLLTVLAPRHASRGDAIAQQLSSFTMARRSLRQQIHADTQIYLADTMGELGLLYRLCPIAFIGGSLVPHGGQNPLEAARLNCAIILGPHTENFTAVCRGLEQASAVVRVKDEAALAQALSTLLTDTARARELCTRALTHVQQRAGMMGHIMNELRRYLEG